MGAQASKESGGGEAARDTCVQCGCEGTGAPLQRCAACASVHYCSKDCQKKHWTDGKHKEACKELARVCQEWFQYPDEVSRLVKRTGLDRPAVLRLLEKHKPRKGSYPVTKADEAEAYGMSVWIYDLKQQLAALDESLSTALHGPKPAAGYSISGLLGYGGGGAKKQTLEELHAAWLKGGKPKGATHENFFDAEHIQNEIKIMRQVARKAPAAGEIEVDDADVEGLCEKVPALSADHARKALQILSAEEKCVFEAEAATDMVQGLAGWDEEGDEIPEEIAMGVSEKHTAEVVAWQVRALLILLDNKTKSDQARADLRSKALKQKRHQKRAMDLCRALPAKVTDLMTCHDCCKGLVLITKETQADIRKHCDMALKEPWIPGCQHLKMNEYLLSMDQVVGQLEALYHDPDQKISKAHREKVQEGYEAIGELVEQAWEACVLGAAGVLLPGDEKLEEPADDFESMSEVAKERNRVQRLIECYRMSTQMRVANENYDKDDSLKEALANFAVDRGYSGELDEAVKKLKGKLPKDSTLSSALNNMAERKPGETAGGAAPPSNFSFPKAAPPAAAGAGGGEKCPMTGKEVDPDGGTSCPWAMMAKVADHMEAEKKRKEAEGVVVEPGM